MNDESDISKKGCTTLQKKFISNNFCPAFDRLYSADIDIQKCGQKNRFSVCGKEKNLQNERKTDIV